MTQRSRYGIPAALLLALLVLAGCSAPMGDSSSSVAPASHEAALDESVDDASAVVITGTITITSDDPLLAAESATELVQEAGGRVSARYENSASSYSPASATLTLRVPAEKLDELRAELAELGRVDSTRLESVEVGAAQRDLDARISTLRTSIARYTAWLQQSDDIEDLIALETAISERQSQLERLEAEQRSLADQVALSTIEITFRSSVSAGDPPAENFWDGLVRGWQGFLAFWAGTLVVLGYALPWLALIGAVTVGVVWLIRRRRRRRPAVPVAQSPVQAPPQPAPDPRAAQQPVAQDPPAQ